MIQGGLTLGGIWIAQYNFRRLCGAQLNSVPVGSTIEEVLPSNPPKPYPEPNPFLLGSPLDQSGPDGWCSFFGDSNYNAQMEYESPDPGVVSGSNDFAHSSLCSSNALLSSSVFPAANQSSGMDGFEQYMSWIKAQLIAGHSVAIRVLHRSDSDSQYDHSPTDASYYPDDVLFFDDHGVYSIVNLDKGSGKSSTFNYPSIPPGANDTNSCATYTFGYEFRALAATRQQANKRTSNAYSIIVPRAVGSTQQGTDGYESEQKVTLHNWGVAISGPIDDDHVLLPLEVTLLSSRTDGVENPKDSIVGYYYEHPMIGYDAGLSSQQGLACHGDRAGCG